MGTELSSDLVEEILSWVPARSLARLRYTCKQWETLIAEPRFVNKHLSHMHGREQQFKAFNIVPTLSFPYSSTVSCVGIDFNKLEEPCLNIQVYKPILFPNLSLMDQVVKMLHCDGILVYVMNKRLLVLNPLFKEVRWIECGHHMDKYAYAYGFGYVGNQPSSSCCNDYKVVRFPSRSIFGDSLMVEVYSFKSDSWKVVFDKTFDGFGYPASSVCLRGTPYWLGFSKYDARQTSSIQSFDFSKERFEPLVLPPPLIGSSNRKASLSLGIYKGDQLSLLHQIRLTGKIQLWVKKKQHWSMLMTVDVRPNEVSVFPAYSSYFVENNGKLVLAFAHKSVKIYVVGENQECQQFEYKSCLANLVGGYYYVPSLLRVPSFSRCE